MPVGGGRLMGAAVAAARPGDLVERGRRGFLQVIEKLLLENRRTRACLEICCGFSGPWANAGASLPYCSCVGRCPCGPSVLVPSTVFEL